MKFINHHRFIAASPNGTQVTSQYADGNEELYDHIIDFYERTNLAADPESSAVMENYMEHSSMDPSAVR